MMPSSSSKEKEKEESNSQDQQQSQAQVQQQPPRNFRQNYYTSLGFHVLEVKPTLENAFAGDVLDLDRLANLCLWVRIPHLYRPLVWKVLLGVLPTSKTTWEYVENQRLSQFQDLKTAAIMIYGPQRKKFTSYSKVSSDVGYDGNGIELTAELMVQMLLIQLNRIEPHRVVPYPSPTFENLEPIASCFLDICDSATKADAFWLFKFFAMRELRMVNFVAGNDSELGAIESHQQKRTSDSITNLWKLLQQQDQKQDHDLVERLHDLEVDLEEACESWFANYFADVLPPESLERIWDVLFGGSPAILDYVALCLILAIQRQIQASKSAKDVYNLFKGDTISNYVNHQAVVSSAIDLWEKPILETMPENSRTLIR